MIFSEDESIPKFDYSEDRVTEVTITISEAFGLVQIKCDMNQAVSKKGKPSQVQFMAMMLLQMISEKAGVPMFGGDEIPPGFPGRSDPE